MDHRVQSSREEGHMKLLLQPALFLAITSFATGLLFADDHCNTAEYGAPPPSHLEAVIRQTLSRTLLQPETVRDIRWTAPVQGWYHPFTNTEYSCGWVFWVSYRHDVTEKRKVFVDRSLWFFKDGKTLGSVVSGPFPSGKTDVPWPKDPL